MPIGKENRPNRSITSPPSRTKPHPASPTYSQSSTSKGRHVQSKHICCQYARNKDRSTAVHPVALGTQSQLARKKRHVLRFETQKHGQGEQLLHPIVSALHNATIPKQRLLPIADQAKDPLPLREGSSSEGQRGNSKLWALETIGRINDEISSQD